ncbi:MAG: carboxypeptidase regulatory-like domain-containing protein [Planctomycetota bacterium]|nr:carboxypeptidase regulatory-like domain-containing protein [Planctomycetota bacterium]MDA1249245.1 carboxypeptidase regulatory-like domain-containing protein [Planctomycetota bacterium]
MKLYAILPLICLALIIGCDLSSVDPGGGASSPTDVSLRGAPPETNGGDGGGGGPVNGHVELDVPPGTLLGQIQFDGTFQKLPARIPKALITADPAVCGKAGDILDESLVVDSGTNGVANVFIYLAKRPDWLDKKPEWDPQDKPLEGIDQLYCVFTPHALLARTGKFVLKNSDAATHNVKSGSKLVSFNLSMSPGAEDSVEFNRAEKEPFASSCAIHAWMAFYTLVIDHPYAAVTDEKGMFRIENLPAGTHEFRVWQERGGLIDRKFTVTVPSGAETELQVRKYPASKFNL